MHRCSNIRVLLSIGLVSLLLFFAQSAVRAQDVFDTNFENFTATNWQGWYSDNGVWQVGAPTNPNGPGSAHGGTQCASTGLASNYPTGSSSRLVSPGITLPTVSKGQNILLEFWQWFQWDQYSRGDVEVSAWNGTSWGSWSQVSDSYQGSSIGWSYVGRNFPAVDLTSYAGQKIRLGFNHINGFNGSAPGWNIDDISISVASVADLSPTQMITFENFASTNWQGWYSDNEVWQIGSPTNPAGPGAAYNGTQCASTGLASNYPAGYSSRLISPGVTLPTVSKGQNILLEFWQWFQWDQYSRGDVEISAWNGKTWGSWSQVSVSYQGSSIGWAYVGRNFPAVDLTAYAGQRIRLGFNHINGFDGSDPGWYIDDISINVSSIPDLALNHPTTFENFTATNWQGWYSDNEVWQIGVPTNVAGPSGMSDGTQCASTGLASNYPAGYSSRFISPAVTLPIVSKGQNILLQFWQWFQWDQYSHGDVEVSTWSGTAWNNWTRVSDTYSGTSNGWQYVGLNYPAVDLTAYSGQRIRLGFNHINGFDGSAPGWYIDDVSILLPPPAISSFAPTSGFVGSTVTLAGTFFSGATGVEFNGKAATFTVNSDSQITATVPSGATTGSITVTTPSGTGTSAAVYTVLAAPASVTVSPTSVTGGSSSTGTVTLTGPAGPGGQVVTLTSSNTAAATVSASVTVAAGATTATFTITTKAVSSNTTVTITVAISVNVPVNGGSKTTTLTVKAPVVASASLSPTSVTGGASSTGTVTLTGPAGPGGQVVTLTSSNTAAATVPASVTVAAGATTATFTVTTKAVSSTATVTITGTANGVSKTVTLTVNAPVVASVALSPTSVTGGATSTGTVTLTGPAGPGGQVVTLSSSNTAAATVSASVTVAAGATTATFTITTKAVSSTATVTITGTDNGVSKTVTLTVNAPVAASASLSPTSVTGGATSTGTVTLTGPAGPGGQVVTLNSSNTAAATVSASVTVAAGSTTATFTITTKAVSSNTTVTITVAANGGSKTTTLTVNAPVATVASVTVGSASVTGGASFTGTLTLTIAAPTGGLVITLSSSNTAAATVPASVTVAAGSTTATFTVTTKAVSATTTVTLTATANSASKTATLTVNALTLPPAPTGVTATSSGSTITLKWNPVSGATGYWVKWALRNGGPFTKLPSLTTGTSINLSGAVAGVTYYYEISAVNGVGEGANSAQVSVTPMLSGLPSAPTGVVATASGSVITITWNPVSGATGYWVKWALRNGGPFTKLSSLTTGTSVNLSGAVAGVTYYYEVSAVNGVGEGANSAQVSITPTLSGLPSAPTGVVATASGSTITLKWNPVSGATGYWVKWALRNGGPFTKLSSLTTGTSVSLSGAVAGVTYYYEVSAVNGVGEGVNSAQVSVTPTVAGLPPAPTGVTATASGSTITLAWNPVTGATGYWVKWALRNGGPFTKMTTLTTGTTITLPGAVAGVTYYYEISAVNSVGEGPNSAQVSVRD